MAVSITDYAERFDRPGSAARQPRTAGPSRPSAATTQSTTTAANQASRAAGGSGRVRNAAAGAANIGNRVEQGVAKASNATKSLPGGKAAARALNNPLTRGIGRVAAPVMIGEGVLAGVNTDMEEAAKLAEMEPYEAQDGDPWYQRAAGTAKNAFIRSLPAAYNTAENFGIIGIADAIPGVEMPRMQGGRYVPADQVDDTDIGDILSGANQMFRSAGNYDGQQQASQAQASQQPGPTPPQQRAASSERPTTLNPRPTGSSRVDTSRNVRGQSVYESQQGNTTRLADTPADPLTALPPPAEAEAGRVSTYDGAAATRAYDDASQRYEGIADRQQQERRENAALRRQREQDIDTRNQRVMRDQQQRKIQNSVAYRNSNDPGHQQAIANLAALQGNTQGQQTGAGVEGQVDASTQRLTEAQARNQELQVSQAEQLQDMQRRIFALSQTDPEAAQALTRQYRAMTGGSDGPIKTQRLIMRDAEGNPLAQPVPIDVQVDPLTGQEYGGIQGGAQGMQAGGTDPTGGLSRDQWVRAAQQIASNRGTSKSELEAEYDRLAGNG